MSDSSDIWYYYGSEMGLWGQPVHVVEHNNAMRRIVSLTNKERWKCFELWVSRECFDKEPREFKMIWACLEQEGYGYVSN